MAVQLGDRARDTITGFTGIVTARTEWLNGCVRICIQPEEIKDGKMPEAHTFDVEQIEVIAPGARKVAPRRGGPMPDAVR